MKTPFAYPGRRISCLLAGLLLSASPVHSTDHLEVEQITQGPGHHFFGYIGHVQNIPWNGSERYILALRSSFMDHLPGAREPADVVLMDVWPV